MASSDVRIVVIDDVSDVADALAMQLSLDGYQVETAYSVEKAVLCVELLQPHCVIFDIAMPGLDGHALVTMLRHRFKDQMVLVAITGSSPSEARVRETVSLVDHYFQKPVDLMHCAAFCHRRSPWHLSWAQGTAASIKVKLQGK